MSTEISVLQSVMTVDAKFAGKTLQDYEVLAVMGNGAFGTCYKVRDKASGDLYAWKGVNYDELDDSHCESLISEIDMLRQLQHPNIVQYYHYLVNREAKSIYIVMECCVGGDLARLISRARKRRQRFEEPYIWRVLFQLCRALQMCHNKIPAGTILHRDIKPANIFLDEVGNAKLGDFGLARMLRRDQSFAASFVGTPHYMSPELVKGRKYDRKSDVWAVGCLVYELCALRPPFRGRAFEQLSENIAHGQFSTIPSVYGADLQAIIAFMLAVDHEQRPGIEVITRHPLVVRNISSLDGEFPRLVEAEPDFHTHDVAKLFDDERQSPNLSSTMLTDQYSFNECQSQRRLRLSGVFTPDLRAELFYSARRRIFPGNKMQRSDPALYESIRRESETAAKPAPLSPDLITQQVFNEALQARLHAVRAQESLLAQRAAELQLRADKLQAAEERVQALERELQERLRQAAAHSQANAVAPPIPPRKPPTTRLNDTYCSIELNDTSPTVAKLNLATLAVPKTLQNTDGSSNATTLRRVTFQPTQKINTYDIENVPPVPQPMQTSVSSKGSNDDSGRNAVSTRRKSLFALFGLSRQPKASSAKQQPAAAVNLPTQLQAPPVTTKRVPLAVKPPAQQQQQQQLANIWTKEQKRAAFDLLAAMNAAEKEAANAMAAGGRNRQYIRQSVRERNTTMQRSRARRSLIVGGQQRQQLVGINCQSTGAIAAVKPGNRHLE